MLKTNQQVDLIGHLELTEQQTLFNSDKLKYSASTIKELNLILSSRNYVNLTWELSHLIWVLVHSDREASILHFFYIDESVFATSAQSWFADADFFLPDNHQISITPQGLDVKIRDHVFTVNWSRVNLLSGLIEILIVLLPDLIGRSEFMHTKGLNSIKTLAAEFQKALYDWSESFMSSARTHKKYIALAQEFSDLDIRQVDERFLCAWESLNDIEGFLKIGNFYSSLCSFLAAKAEVAHVESLSETSDEMIANEKSVYDFILSNSQDNLIESLPSKPKVLSQNQVKKIAVVFDNASFANRLIWSSYAVLSFNQIQAQLVQAKRSNVPLSLKQKIIDDIEHYDTQMAFLSALREINEQTMLMCLDLVKSPSSNYLIEAIVENKQWLARLNIGSVDDRVNEKVIASAENLVLMASTLFEEAQLAVKNTKRQGLTHATKLDDGAVYVDLIKKLVKINALIDQLVGFKCECDSTDSKFLSDCSIVKSVFKQRYLVE